MFSIDEPAGLVCCTAEYVILMLFFAIETYTSALTLDIEISTYFFTPSWYCAVKFGSVGLGMGGNCGLAWKKVIKWCDDTMVDVVFVLQNECASYSDY